MHPKQSKNPIHILDFVPEAGELGQRIATHDWSATSLGPIDTWPQSLRTCVHIMLSSRQPIWIGWGKELIKLYNDPYRSIVGGKHPWALGTPAAEVWKDIWHDIEPLLKPVMEEGIGTYVESQLLIMERNGYREETYYTFSYTPIPGDEGRIAGMFCANTDDTERIINERQLKTLTQLGKRLVDSKTTAQVITNTIATLGENKRDFPFAVFRTLADNKLTLAHATQLDPTLHHVPHLYDLAGEPGHVTAAMQAALNTRKIQVFDHLAELGRMPTGAWAEQPSKVIILPIFATGSKEAFGTITIGLNPYRLFDEKYESFILLLADQIAASLADVNAFEQERRRSQALADIDTAKTAFFSNISHELRTPLTLMLAPIEDTLNDPDTIPENRDRMDIAYRNARRLLKLVNTLLDFSRIEAGRTQAKFQNTNLAPFTKDLVSTFRAAIEKAGMQLHVNTPQTVRAYIDTEMWEKIVLNLVSNAFKYTHQGTITVTLTQHPAYITLAVADTGIGIPPEEQARIFERFHRVQNVGGRSQEGTGIGLALVEELVKLHGGAITLQSALNHGSTFTVSIPVGKAHLPPAQIVDQPVAQRHTSPDLYVEEVMKWLPDHERLQEQAAHDAEEQTQKKYRILLADDNADMRDYLTRLLSKTYHVTAVGNGLAAINEITHTPPDLVLSDVMMPELDGFELVAQLKNSSHTRHIPVILLSARAGEEATIEGLATGADDYLIKPFSAKELLTRIHSNIKIAESRVNSVRQIYNLFMNAPVAIAVINGPDLRFEMANERYLQMAGKEMVVGKTFDEAFPELNGKGLKELLTNVYTTGEPFYGNEFELDLMRQGRKEHLYLNFAYTPLKNTENESTGIMVIATDVTDMVHARQRIEHIVTERTEELTRANLELKRSEDRYHRMVDEVEDYAIILLNKNGIVQNWNKGAEKIKGYKETEIVGKSFDSFYLNEDKAAGVPQQLLAEAAANGKATREGWRVKKSGERFWGSTLITALHDLHGNVTGFSKVTRDLTERKLAEDKLHQYSKDLEIQNRELEQFAYAASHDLKEPLRKISFFGTSLAERIAGQIDEKSTTYLTRILTSTRKMTNLVDNLLNYSKTTANTEAIRQVDLNATISDILETLQHDTENGNFELHTAPLPTVAGIPFQYAQLFDNLIQNAIKYAQPGQKARIDITYTTVHTGTPQNPIPADYHKISVADNGIGFEPEYAEKIFEIFQRLESIPDKSGAGIGLAICKRIVLNHNGYIYATSQPGQGATFYIYLPVTAAHQRQHF